MKNQDATLHIRLDTTLRAELESMQIYKGHSKLSVTIREALDEYVSNNKIESEAKVLESNFL